MGETSRNNIEIIAELNQIPTDMFAPKTKLTHAYAEDDSDVYGIRDFIPHPIMGTPEGYAPGRGVDLTEEELKLVCVHLRQHMYAVREFCEMDEDDLLDIFGDEDDIEDEEYDEDEDNIGFTRDIHADSSDVGNIIHIDNSDIDTDPVGTPDFIKELNCVYIEDVAEFNDKKIAIMEWGDDPVKYDIRVWTDKVNKRGYMESTPEIDKGISIDDYQAELLCQAIEDIFPDLAETLEEFRSDDWEETADTIQVELTDKERRIIIGAIAADIDNVSNCAAEWNERASTKGNELASRHIERMIDLSNKIKVHDRLTDRDLISCCSLFETVSEFIYEPDPEHLYEKLFPDMSLNEIHDSLKFLSKKFVNVVNKKRLSGNINEIPNKTVKVDASKSEFMNAVEVLELLQNAIYGRGNTSNELKEIGKAIDKLVSDEIAERTILDEHDYECSQTPGNDFFNDLITAFVMACEE